MIDSPNGSGNRAQAPGTPAIAGAEFSPAYFDRMALLEDGHVWTRAMRGLTLALLGRREPGHPRRVLDVGCGTGRFLRDWQELVAPGVSVGVDLHIAALAHARNRCSARLAAASAAALPFADRSFDAIHCADVLQHLTLRDAGRALDEFSRVLVPGGLVALRVRGSPALRGEAGRDHAHAYSQASLRDALRSRGFDVEFMSRVNALPSLWAEIRDGLSPRRAGHAHAHAAVKHIHPRARHDPRSLLLRTYLRLERACVSRLPVGLPFGHTIICVARLKD